MLANPAPLERVVDTALGMEVVRKVPGAYDGVTPLPLILALHATNFSATGAWTSLAKDQPAAARYVVVAPQAPLGSSPSSFENLDSNDFSVLLGEVLNELCIDQRRIFGVGNGSGGRGLFKWIGYVSSKQKGVQRLRAAAMVGTYIGKSPKDYALPTIFIHPLVSSNSRGVANDEDGTKALEFFRSRNGCGDSSTSVTAASCVAGGMPVNPGCVDFDVCAEPLRFRHHDDLTMQSNGDPWSCMASAAIFQFFEPYLAVAPTR